MTFCKLFFICFFSFFISVFGYQSDFESLLKTPLFKGVDIGVRVERLGLNGESQVLFSYHDQETFVPASMMKLLLSAAVLHHFSPFYYFETPIQTNGRIEEGILDGDVFLIGRGDPAMDEMGLLEVIKTLKSLGVKLIQGDICYDLSFFNEDQLPMFGSARHYYTASGPLNCNFNTIDLKVRMGKTPKLWLDPDTVYADLIDSEVQFSSSVEHAYRPQVTYRQFEWGDQFIIKGRLSWADYYNNHLKFLVTRPGFFTATLFKQLCESQGIVVEGQVRLQKAAQDSILLYKLKTLSVAGILKVLNQDSNNMVASVLNKSLGAYYYSLPGSKDKGLEVIRSFCFNQLGFQKGDFVLADASGLSIENQFSVSQFSQLLKYTYFDDMQEFFLDSLQGHRKHMFHHLVEVPSYLDVKFKTGTLSGTGVNSVSGYIFDQRQGDVYTFVVMTRDFEKQRLAYTGLYTDPILNLILKQIAL